MLVHPESEFHREPPLLVPRIQPRGAIKVDRSHTLSKNLVGCWLFNHANDTFHDLTGRNHGDRSGSLTKGITKHGCYSYVTNNNTTDGIDIGTIDSANPLRCSNGKISIFGLLEFGRSLSSSHGNANPNILDNSSGALGAGGYTLYNVATSTRTEKIHFDFGSGVKQIRATVPSDVGVLGTTHFFGLSLDTNNTQNRFVHVDCQTLSLLESGTGTMETGSVSGTLLNSSHTSDRQYRHPVYFLFVWNAVLPLGAHRSLCNNPYQFLMPA